MPKKANKQKQSTESPRALAPGQPGQANEGGFDEENAHRHEDQKRNQLRDGHNADGPGARAHAADIDRGQHRVNDKHQRSPRDSAVEPRRQSGHRPDKKIHDGRHAQERRRAEKQTGDEADVAPERDLGVSVKPARERDAAARESESRSRTKSSRSRTRQRRSAPPRPSPGP